MTASEKGEVTQDSGEMTALLGPKRSKWDRKEGKNISAGPRMCTGYARENQRLRDRTVEKKGRELPTAVQLGAPKAQWFALERATMGCG